MTEDMEILTEKINEHYHLLAQMQQELAKVIVGQKEMLESITMAMLCGGHILFEGMPGLAKTLLVKTFAEVVDFQFQRVQFTPDLLPADLIGTLIFNPKEGKFATRKGPIFTHLLLADEINRAPAKVQSALLQAMEEKEVTIGNSSFALPQPFLVMATENPIDQEGTYPLPEAQSDRFLMKVFVEYPQPDEEHEIIARDLAGRQSNTVKKILNIQDCEVLQSLYQEIYVDSKLIDYAVALVSATRDQDKNRKHSDDWIEYGASPRASINLIRAARAQALLRERAFVKPEDIRYVAHRILRHRIILTYEAEAAGITTDSVIDQMLQRVEVP